MNSEVHNKVSPSGFACVLRSFWRHPGITVELSEIQQVGDDATYGQYELSEDWYLSLALFAGVEPLDTDCPNSGKCMGLLTRVSAFSFFFSALPFLLTRHLSPLALSVYGYSLPSITSEDSSQGSGSTFGRGCSCLIQ